MHRIKLEFPGVSKEALESKLEDSIKKFNLAAEYEDGSVTITGHPQAIQQIKMAYSQQKMIHDLMGQLF